MKKLDNKKLKAFRYRIYPNKNQRIFFAQTFGCVRFVWNLMLNEKIEALKNKQPIPQVTPAKYKEDFPLSISDSGFGKFLDYLEYKADWYGRTLIVADDRISKGIPKKPSCCEAGSPAL